jgi:hypothetical protein
LAHHLNAGGTNIAFDFFLRYATLKFRMLLFTILHMGFKKSLDQMGLPSLRAFPDLSAGMNVIDRLSLSTFEGSEKLKKFARFEEKMRSFASHSNFEGEGSDLSLLDIRIWISHNP